MKIRVELGGGNGEPIPALELEGDAWLQVTNDPDSLGGKERAYALCLRGVKAGLVAQIADRIELGWVSGIIVTDGDIERVLYPVETEPGTKLIDVKKVKKGIQADVKRRKVRMSKKPDGDLWRWSRNDKNKF